MNGIFKRWWSKRQPRQQQFLLLAAFMLALFIVWLILWQPASKGIAQLQNELPALRTQNAALLAMADEAKALRAGSRAAATLPADQRMTTVQQSLTRLGITAQTTGEGDRIHVSIADLDYAAWATWLASAETELGARTLRAEITALKPPAAAGHVHAETVLDFSVKGGPYWPPS